MSYQKSLNEVISRLDKGQVINVYSTNEDNMAHFTSKIQTALQRKKKHICIFIDISSCYQNIDSFYQSLRNGLAPLNTSGQPLDSSRPLELINKLLDNNSNASTPSKIICCLLSFDKLENAETDKRYDNNFFSFINGLRNISQVGVLFTSTRALEYSDIQVAGKAVRGSRIDISIRKALPHITSAIVQEHLSNSLSENTRHQLAEKPNLCEFIAQQPYPIRFATYLIDNYPNNFVEFSDTDLKKYYGQFQKSENRSINNRISHIDQWLKNWKARLMQILDLLRLTLEIKTIIIIIISIITILFLIKK